MVPVVGLLRCPSACPDLGAFFRGIFLGHIGGHVEQNSVCRDTNAVDERNQPHLVFWLYFIIFLQYFPLFFGFLFRLGGPPARWLLRTLWVVGAFPVPRGAAPRCPPGPGRGPGFLWKKAGGKNTREEEVLPPWTHLFWLGGPCGGSLFFSAWPAALYLTPITARPPAGRAGGGGFADGKGQHSSKPSPWGEGGPAKPGRMRGRFGTQPFLVEKEGY